MYNDTIDLLVLSDRYLPYSVGGAELSLHSIIKQIPRNKKVLVIAIHSIFNRKIEYTYEGVNVLSIPAHPNYPLQMLHPIVDSILNKVPFIKKLIITKFLKPAFTKFGSNNSETRKALLKYADESVMYNENYVVKQIHKALEGKTIKVIHADNLRSICLARHFTAEKQVNIIRDNRFHETPDVTKLSETESLIVTHNLSYRHEQLSKANVIGATSKILANSVKNKFPDLNVKQISNPIDDPEMVAKYTQHIAEDIGFNIVIIGMLTENKGQVQFIKALKNKIFRENITIHLIGKGDRIKKRIIEISEEAGIRDKIVFHGYIDRQKTYQIIKSSQVVVLPTIWEEPFGRVPLEAALAFKPVVSFASGGLKESIVDKKTGFLVKKGDFHSLWEKIIYLKSNPDFSYEMGHSANKHIIKTFDQKFVAKNLFDLWEI